METSARVLTRRGGKLRLSCESMAPCGPGCVCARGWFGRRSGGQLELDAEDAPPGSVPGDRLLVSIDDRALLAAALAMYVPPVVGLLLGAGLARWLAGDSAAMALAGSVAGGTIGLLVARWLLSRRKPAVRLRRPLD